MNYDILLPAVGILLGVLFIVNGIRLTANAKRVAKNKQKTSFEPLKQREAYLVAFFDVEFGAPVYLRSGIYSADAMNLTGAISYKTHALDVLRAEGSSYEDAISNLCKTLTHPVYGPLYKWALTPGIVAECEHCGFTVPAEWIPDLREIA